MGARVVLMDGAIGTELQALGLEPGTCGEAWNLDRPELVAALHQRYLAAGAEVVITNTFGGSSIALARHGEQARSAALNEAAARLARAAAGPDRLVLGDIGPFGGFIAPLGEYSPEAVLAAFREQAEALLAGGADGILVETMSGLDELTLAVEAARAAGAPRVLASLAFDSTRVGPRTMMGVTPEQAAARALELGIDVLGANCGTALGMSGYADVLRRFRAAAPALPLLCRPNAGTPVLSGEDVVYGMAPAAFAAELDLLIEAGAAWIGGCCGTTPAHIAAVRAALQPVSPA